MHLGDQLEVKVFEKIRAARAREMEVDIDELEVDIEVNCRMGFCQRVAHVGEHTEDLGLGSPLVMAEIISHETCRQWGIISMALALWRIGHF